MLHYLRQIAPVEQEWRQDLTNPVTTRRHQPTWGVAFHPYHRIIRSHPRHCRLSVPTETVLARLATLEKPNQRSVALTEICAVAQ